MGFTNAGLANGGQTAHYQISYDDTFSPAAGLTRAAQLMDTCEADFDLMQSWFSGVSYKFAFPIGVQIQNVSGGAKWRDPADIEIPFGYHPTVTIMPGAVTSVDIVRYLLASEVTEMFMASQGDTWFGDTTLFTNANEGSKGEGLSLFLGAQLPGLPAASFSGFQDVPNWLNAPTRPNYVDNNPDDLPKDPITGCTTCFIYYLHNQLGYSINRIIAAGASTLGGVYTNLTGKTDGWQSFIDLVDLHYPRGTSYSPIADNIFPVPNLQFLQNAQILSGSTETIGFLELDTSALCAVTVALKSDNPAVLTVPPQVTIPVGGLTAGFVLEAAAVTGPLQTVAIHATYAGTTLSANVQILPRPSIIVGQVTDASLNPIADASIDLQPNPLPGLLSTDSSGRYQTPVLAPNAYQFTVLKDGYVPSKMIVNVLVGVPVTTQNFVLAVPLPFTVAGTVIDGAGKPIAGATVSLSMAAQVTTDANGQYSISLNPGSYVGDYTIAAAAAGYTTSGVTIATIPNGATITENFELLLLGSLTGTITDEAKTPFAGAAVAAGTRSATSDASGKYAIAALDPGAATVIVSAFGYDTSTLAVTISPGAATTQDIVLVKGSATITGAVMDETNVTPLSGATVTAGAWSAVTDGSGNYTISNIPAGPIRVSASALHYTPDLTYNITLSDHQTVELTFQMQRIGRKGPPQ